MSQANLFALPDNVRPGGNQGTPASGWQAVGVAVQMTAIARLLNAGHKVAVPVTDDDGVDLIVDYRTKVQVKSSSQRDEKGNIRIALMKKRNGRYIHLIPDHVDVLLVHARDTGCWWVIPTGAIDTKHSNLRLLERSGGYVSQNRRTMAGFMGDWDLFERLRSN